MCLGLVPRWTGHLGSIRPIGFMGCRPFAQLRQGCMEHHGHAKQMPMVARSEEGKLVLQIRDYLPPDCSDRVEARLLDVPGVRAASVNPMMGTVTVTLAPEGSSEAVGQRLREIGVECGARPSTMQIAEAEHWAHATGRPAEHNHNAMMEQEMRRRFFVVLGLAIPVLILSPTIQSWAGFRLPDILGLNVVLVVLASIIVLYGGVPFYRGAATALRARTADMDVLVSSKDWELTTMSEPQIGQPTYQQQTVTYPIMIQFR